MQRPLSNRFRHDGQRPTLRVALRAVLSVILGLVFGLAPLISAVPAMADGWSANAEESHLPACCRRHGVHHCTMDAHPGVSLADHTRETSVSARCCCPCWPSSVASSEAPFAAIASQHMDLSFRAERRSAAQADIAAGISDRRTWPKRGPPSQTL